VMGLHILVLFSLIFHYVVSSNISTSTSTTLVQYIPMHDDLCTNECSDTDPRYWCGNHKEDPAGRVMRCVQYTRYGEICVAECGGRKKYNWCLTNALKLSEGDWWDYCSLVGYTINKDPCVDECGRQGEKYWWCHTSKDDTSAWDYCSPPGLVKPVQYTVRGDQCISECRQHGENYHWCTKSMDYCDEDSCDDDWDYCSLDQLHTRYNYQCREPCSRQGGTNYYWCYQEDGSWEYCSPVPQLGVHISDHVELTRYGVKCRDKCGLKGEDYYWCTKHGGSLSSWWDYCSPSPNITINQGACKDNCSTRGSNYFWCHTDDTWDYCSPLYEGGLSYESVAAKATYSHTVSISTIAIAMVLLTTAQELAIATDNGN